MKLKDPNEICSKLFKKGDTKTFQSGPVIDGIEYLINEGHIDWIELDTDKPTTLNVNPTKGRELEVLAEVMCWKPAEVNWECETENKDFTVAMPIRSLRDMSRPKNNLKKIEKMYKKMQEEGSEDQITENIQRNGLFVRIDWR